MRRCDSVSTGKKTSRSNGRSRIAFSEMVSTLMACTRPGGAERERRYLAALGAAGEFEWAGNRLTIHYDDGRGALNFIRLGG